MSEDDTIEMIVEIPRGTRNKYEYDHERGVIFLDRRLFSSTVYPADYGFIPGTLSEDGDPLDALALTEDGTFPGCYIRVRPVGIFRMRDEHGIDAKVIAVPANDPLSAGVRDIGDLPSQLRDEISHFFEVYKDLEPGKDTEIEGYQGVGEAWAEIRASQERLGAEEGGG
jgi:inorganic pyrophosphatase